MLSLTTPRSSMITARPTMSRVGIPKRPVSANTISTSGHAGLFRSLLLAAALTSIRLVVAQVAPTTTSEQTSNPQSETQVMAQTIVTQGARLTTPSTVTQSYVQQHEKRRTRPRTRKNMVIAVPTILAVLAVITWTVRRHAVLAAIAALNEHGASATVLVPLPTTPEPPPTDSAHPLHEVDDDLVARQP